MEVIQILKIVAFFFRQDTVSFQITYTNLRVSYPFQSSMFNDGKDRGRRGEDCKGANRR